MRIHFKSVLVPLALGLPALIVSGCQSEGTKLDAPGASSSTTTSTVPGAGSAAQASAPNPGAFENAPGLPPVVEAPAGDPNVVAPPLTPIEETVDDAVSPVPSVGEAVDEGVRRTSRQVRGIGEGVKDAIPPIEPEPAP
ncbi:MAG: hypothetical protein AB7I30_22095, partial [Isosphaeraceae bacterium]